MSSQAALRPRIVVNTPEPYWEMAWQNLADKMPEAKGWQCSMPQQNTNGWNTVFRIAHRASNTTARIVQWVPQGIVRDVISWIEGEELVIAVKPSQEAFKTAIHLLKDWVSINGTQSFV